MDYSLHVYGKKERKKERKKTYINFYFLNESKEGPLSSDADWILPIYIYVYICVCVCVCVGFASEELVGNRIF